MSPLGPEAGVASQTCDPGQPPGLEPPLRTDGPPSQLDGVRPRRSRVCRGLEASGIETAPDWRVPVGDCLGLVPATADEIAQVVSLYASGLSLVAVAEKTRFSSKSVFNYLPAEGILLRDTHGRPR